MNSQQEPFDPPLSVDMTRVVSVQYLTPEGRAVMMRTETVKRPITNSKGENMSEPVIKNPRGLLDLSKKELEQAFADMGQRPVEVLKPGMEYIGPTVQRLECKPGDVVVISYPEPLSCAHHAAIVQYIKGFLPEGVRCMVLNGGPTVQVLAPAEAENARLRNALARIQAWEMPPTGDEHSYAWHHGSHGERRVIMGIAAEALAGQPQGTGRIVDVEKGCPQGTKVFNLDTGQEIPHCQRASEPDGTYEQVERTYNPDGQISGVYHYCGKARLKIVLPGEDPPADADQPRIVEERQAKG